MTKTEKEKYCLSQALKYQQHPSWTEEDIKMLIHYWNTEEKTGTAIGLLLGRSRGSIISKVRRLRRYGVDMRTRSGRERKKNRDKELRKCLKCQEDFLSESPFNRICTNCASVNSNIHDRAVMHSTKEIS